MELGAKSPAHAAYLRSTKRQRLTVLASQVALLIGFFAFWELATRVGWADPFLMSQPSKIGSTLAKLHSDGSLYRHSWITIWETIVGFGLGTILGTAIAIGLWWSDFWSKVLDPYLVVLNSLPKVALGPMFIIWFGTGMSAIVSMALAVSIVVTIIQVYTGFSSLDANYLKLARSFGATKWQILKMVVLPASLPTIVSALKVNVGLSLVGVIVGEFLVAKEGLGFLIIYGGQVFNLNLVMTSTLILLLVATVMYLGVAKLERLIARNR
ncbi:MAG: ABC transporter permease [Bacillota bacterium]